MSKLGCPFSSTRTLTTPVGRPGSWATAVRSTPAASSRASAASPRASAPTALIMDDSAPSAAAWIATLAGAPPKCSPPSNTSHSTSPSPTTTGLGIRSSREAQPPLDLLERHAFGLRNHRQHPHELQRHHPAEEEKDRPGREVAHHQWERGGEQRGEHPVCRAAERLARRAVGVGEDLGDQNPDHGALADRVRRDKGEDAGRHDGDVAGIEGPRAEAERRDVAERADEQQRAPAEPVDEPEADEGEDEVRDADADRLQQRRLLAETGEAEYARREVEDRVDAGELVEERDEEGERDGDAEAPGPKALARPHPLAPSPLRYAQGRLFGRGGTRAHEQPARALGDAETHHHVDHRRDRGDAEHPAPGVGSDIRERGVPRA